jgi:hypothetical protein
MPTKQARRERHLGRHGERARVQLFLSANTKAQLDRLARRKDALIEELVATAEHWVTARLSGKGSSDITGANRHCASLRGQLHGNRDQPRPRAGFDRISRRRAIDFDAQWTPAMHDDPALVRIIIRSQLFQRHQDDEKNAHPHTHGCGSYPEDQVLRNCLLPAHLTEP